MYRLTIALVICVAANSCGTSKKTVSTRSAEEWRSVGVIGGVDEIAMIHVRNLLKSHGIDCRMDGSVGYGVCVVAQDAKRALDILRKDLATNRYWIILYDGETKQEFSIPEDQWITATPKKSYESLISEPKYSASTDLGAALRDPSVRNTVLRYPYVAQVRSLSRQYMDESGGVKTGHDVHLELTANHDADVAGAQLFFQVWDDGKRVEGHGSTRWERTDPERSGSPKPAEGR